jgi:hypothetical protein
MLSQLAEYGLTRGQAAHLRRLMSGAETTTAIDAALETANVYLTAHGIEAVRDGGWSNYWLDTGLLYVNMGDCYIPTIIFDSRKQRFECCCLGDIAERYPNRFV